MSKTSQSSQTLNSNEKRILKDVVKIMKNPLNNQGIYYIHDVDNLYKGYCLIIGPQDTIYAHGLYFFELEFPKDYPFSPPKVIYETNNHNIRFNPNLYRNGKVCISILNTWHGPQWTSCQTISSVLLSLITLLHNKALTNEPGINETHRDFKSYNHIIEYSNYNIAFNEVLSKEICDIYFEMFKEHIRKYIKDNKEKIIEDVNKFIKKYKSKKETKIRTGIYGLYCEMNYSKLIEITTLEINKLIN
tara:strand:+ start:692 stop:1429 length:738 start_codon:yes stop_codon:yes gene_type:complete